MKLTWLGHSSVRIETGRQVIYIDPYAGLDSWYAKASIVLVSRFHFDHCSMEKLKRILTDRTRVFGTKEVVAQVFPSELISVGESKFVEGVEIVGAPVVNPHVDVIRHNEAQNGIGFIIFAEKKKIYFAADSDFEEGMAQIHPDVLLISVGGTYTAGSKEAAAIAHRINPKMAIPIHWGSIEGTRDDAELFAERAECPVTVLVPGGSVEL